MPILDDSQIADDNKYFEEQEKKAKKKKKIIKERKTNMKLFVLQRDNDESGISGEGVVAEGVQFASGKCAMHWLTDTSSIAIYDNIQELETIHGHEGKSRIIWLDK